MGKVHWTRGKGPKLFKHGGCNGCARRCQYNGPVAVKEKAERTKGKSFACNNSRKDWGNGK